MNKTPLCSAIATACCLGLTTTSVGAVDMSVEELHFTGFGGGGFPLDCSAGPAATTDCYATTGTITNATNNFGLFESVDPFYSQPWAAAGVAYFDGFDGSSAVDNDTVTDSANISNGTATTDFGALSQTITPDPDMNPATTDFTWSGVSGQGAFTYTFTLTGNQVAWGTLFNWSVNGGIAVLAIFDCGPTGTTCAPVSTIMNNGPFAGQGAVFAGTGSNFTPVAADTTTSTVIDTLVNIDVLALATDRDETLPVTSPLVVTTAPANGTAVVNIANDGTIDYTPSGLTDGQSDSFEYTVEDSAGLVSAPATVTINITAAPNTAPTADDIAVVVNEDSFLVIPVADASTDPDLPAQTLTFVNVGAASNGTVTPDVTNTSLTYTPDADYNGPDSFTFSINDGIEDSATPGTISITVDNVNDAPVCVDVAQATPVDTALQVATADLVVACTDIDPGAALTFVSADQPVTAGSMVADDGAGTLTYTPAAAFQGNDSFVYNVTDGTAAASASVNVQVGGDLLGNFTMLQNDGQKFGGTNDISFTFADTVDLDDPSTLNQSEAGTDFNLEIKTEGPTAFFGELWVAHHIRVFAPGTYSFDSGCTTAEIEATGCPAGSAAASGPPISMTIPDGMVGAHMLFDWSGNNDLDVVNVWERNAVWETYGFVAPFNELWKAGGGVPPADDAVWELVSRDVNGDGFNGTPMVAGPFVGNYVNFNHKPSGSGEVAPPFTGTSKDTTLGASAMSIWVLLSSLFAVFGLRRFFK